MTDRDRKKEWMQREECVKRDGEERRALEIKEGIKKAKLFTGVEEHSLAHRSQHNKPQARSLTRTCTLTA